MKLNTILAMSAFAFAAIACSHDGTDADTSGIVSGTYKGEMALAVMGNSQDPMALDVVIAPESGNAVSVTLVGDPEATGGMSIKNILLTGIDVTSEGNSVYTLAKNISEEGYTAQDSGTSVNWKFTAIEGTVTGDKAVLKLVGQPGAMPMAMTMDFKGTK